MNTKKILIGLLMAMLAFPTIASAQEQPPGLPAVDFGDEDVPEFETEQPEEEEEEIGSPPSLEIDTGTDPTPEPPSIIVDPPAPTPTPNPNPAPPEMPETGPGLILSLIPALGYTITRKMNK